MTLNNSNLSLPKKRYRERQIPQLRGVLALLVLFVACVAPCLASAQSASVQWQYMPIYEVLNSAYSPDGSMVVVSGRDSLQVFNVNTGAVIKALPTTNNDFVGSVAFSPDGKTLFDAGHGAAGYWLESWNTADWSSKNLQSLQSQNPNTIAVSPDGSKVAVGGAAGPNQLTGFLELHATADLSLLQTLNLMTNTITVYSVSFSPDGTKLAASGASQVGSNPETGSVQVFSLPAGTVTNLPTTAQWNGCVAFSPDGTMVADGGGGYNGASRSYWGLLEVHNLSAGTATKLLTTMSNPMSVQFSSDSKTLLAGGESLSIAIGVATKARAELWDLATATSTLINTSATETIRTARFSPAGNAIELSGQSSNHTGTFSTEEIWNVTGQALIETVDLEYFVSNKPTPQSGPTSMSFSPDGKWVTYSGVNTLGQPTAGLFNGATGQPGITFPSTIAFIGATAMSADGVTFADGGYSGTSPQVGKLELWNANTGALIASLPTTSSVINQVAFSPDGKTVAGAGLNVANGIEFWNVSNGTLQKTLPSIGVILGMAYSSDGTKLVDCGSTIAGETQTGYVQVWTLATQQKITINSACSLVNAVAFSPDGTLVADTGQTPAGGYIVEVWNAVTGAKVSSYNLISSWVSTAIAFTPDGSTIFVGTNFGLYAINPVLGNLTFGNGLLGILPTSCLCVSPDGQFVGVAGGQLQLNESWIAVLNNPLVNPYPIQSLKLNPYTLTGGSSSTGTVTIAKPAPAGGLTINLATLQGSPATVPASVTIPAGQTTATFTINTTAVGYLQDIAIIATNSSSRKVAYLAISPPVLSGISLTPGTVVGGNNSTGTVTLTGPAPSPFITVNLSCNSSYAGVPTSVDIPEGATSANFTVTTQGVSATTTASITATNYGFTGTVSLTINPASLNSIGFNPTSVVGGNTGQGTVTLNGNAPAGGIAVALSASKTLNGIGFPSSVTVPAGSNSATFQVTTQPVLAAESFTLSASFGGNTTSATLTILPATLQGVSVNPSSFAGGQSSLGTVTMTGKVVKPVTIRLSSSSSLVSVPSSVTISANENSANFAVTSKGVTKTQTVTITAKYGTQSMTFQVTVNPAYLSNLTLTPSSVHGGLESIGTVYLAGVAPSSGYTVTLSSSNGYAAVPLTVKIPAGKSLASFAIKTIPVATPQTSSIKATLGASVSATLTVTPPALKSLKLSTTGVIGGQKLLGTITLTSEAPAGGISVSVSSNNSLAVVPSSVMVPAGKSTIQFTIKTKSTTQKVKATITASFGGVSESAAFSIRVH